MTAIFKSSLQNLSPLPTSLKVEPLAKPKTGLNFFVNTTKPKTKVLVVFGQIFETKVFMVICKGILVSMANFQYWTWNREEVVQISLQAGLLLIKLKK